MLLGMSKVPGLLRIAVIEEAHSGCQPVDCFSTSQSTEHHLSIPSQRLAAGISGNSSLYKCSCISGVLSSLLQLLRRGCVTMQTICGSPGTWPRALATRTRGRPSARPAATRGARLGCRSLHRRAAPAEWRSSAALTPLAPSTSLPRPAAFPGEMLKHMLNDLLLCSGLVLISFPTYERYGVAFRNRAMFATAIIMTSTASAKLAWLIQTPAQGADVRACGPIVLQTPSLEPSLFVRTLRNFLHMGNGGRWLDHCCSLAVMHDVALSPAVFLSKLLWIWIRR